MLVTPESNEPSGRLGMFTIIRRRGHGFQQTMHNRAAAVVEMPLR